MRRGQIPTGTHEGSRWTIVREMAPAYRTGFHRRRVWCRCVCGHEQAVWWHDLKWSRSTGCRSASCRNRHAGMQALAQLVPPQLAEQAKDAAIGSGVTIQRIVEEALRRTVT